MKPTSALTSTLLLLTTAFFSFSACMDRTPDSVIDEPALAKTYFEEDADWYLQNIPFFECSDKQMEAVYYYRWKMYKAHIRGIGDNRFVITEFINHVSWDREPYCTINAASMHHIYEGRWLRDSRYMEGYIKYLFQLGGNDRSYSESVADAAYNYFLVNGNADFIEAQLDSMKAIYDRWQDHWDSAKNLYYIPAMPDATEYTIASVDASGGTAGFEGGEAFRPTINSYMYGNARAISQIAHLKGDEATAALYEKRSAELKNNVEQYLWNDSLKHFTDRFKVSNQYVHYWDFIRGRELAGMIPWYFNLPADSPLYNQAWKHVIDTSDLLGAHGLRTNEPSYEYYFKQFVYFMGQRGSQWNGPSWPYQSSQAITAMANMLNNYKNPVITKADYVKLLRLYTQQHILPNGKINLVEDYDPNLGGPIVYYYWSNHYNHSSYNNLILTGLCGIRPSESDTLSINPLVDSSIRYFCVQDVLYHGHSLTLVYDADGSRYGLGRGLTVFVDRRKKALIQNGNHYSVVIGPVVLKQGIPSPNNVAVNIARSGYPMPDASVNNKPDTSLYQSVDGKIWYFPEITNRWTTEGSVLKTDWWSLDFGKTHSVFEAAIYLFADGKTFDVPENISIDYQQDTQWLPVKLKNQHPAKLTGNTVNRFVFDPVTTNKIRLHFDHPGKQVAVSEVEFYE